MNKPSRWSALFTWFPLLAWGVYLEHHRNYAWDMVISIISIETSAVLLLFYFVVAELIWKAYLSDIKVETILPKQEIKQPIPVNVDEKHVATVYSQVTNAPRFDVEKYMAESILFDLENKKEPDFRETTWVNKKRESRFHTRAALKEVLEKWESYNGIERKFPERDNSTYIVKDIRVIRLIASGEKFE